MPHAVTPRWSLATLLPALLAAALGLGCAAPPPASPASAAVAQPPAALHVEGAPPIAQSLLDASQRYSRVAGHALSGWHPDARELLVRHRAPGASTTQLYRVAAPAAPPEVLTDGPDPIAAAQWAPGGRYLVFSRGSGGDEAFQLFRLDPTTHATLQITPAGQRHTLMDWVKPGALALVGSVPLDRTAAGGTRTQVQTTLSLIDPDADPQTAGARRVVAELPGGGWFGARVSPDGRAAAITRYVSATESEVWLIDLASGRRRQLLPAPGSAIKAAHLVSEWSADGRALYVQSDREGEFRELLRVELAGGTPVRLTGSTPWDVQGSSESPDGRLVAVVLNVDGRNELRLIDARTGAAQALPAGVTLPAGSITAATFHDRRNELALVVNSVQGPSQIHSLNLDTGTLVAWTRPAGAEGLDLRALPDQQVVRWKAFDGRTISGILSLPPARFQGPRPVVMLVHGGPEGQATLGWQGRLNYLIQELGVAVLEPNVRGSTGYGKTFLGLDNGALREDSVKDMGSAIDWIAMQPGLDARRVMVWGGSYGGYMALAASTRLADRIAGATAVVGISNFVTFLENTESYRRDLRRAEYGDERDPAMRAVLQRISPLTHVDQITRPLLVVQGRNDPRVPWTESEQIVRSLQRRGTPVWYLLADNEGHGFARRENSDYYFATVMRFVEVTLRP